MQPLPLFYHGKNIFATPSKMELSKSHKHPLELKKWLPCCPLFSNPIPGGQTLHFVMMSQLWSSLCIIYFYNRTIHMYIHTDIAHCKTLPKIKSGFHGQFRNSFLLTILNLAGRLIGLIQTDAAWLDLFKHAPIVMLLYNQIQWESLWRKIVLCLW